ncbi:hypothetical protein GGQ18_002737 [Salinibacter ruber]|uniref:hypothetical protein n=1 Tax=Salinibacter ruber TaxID=146919 RepID=UPI0017F5FEB1|nr:hypothetical protein [Salinibacter ruber]MBB4070129.1 hypothetical protein [Salinibacter ruber]
MGFPKRALQIVGGVLVVYALLVATHLGEFWPFSIYPMFSQAGNPWTRAMVREMPSQTDPDTLSWDAVSLQSLPGASYPLAPKGINQNDVANYVSKTDQWSDERVQGLRSLFTKGRSLSAPLLVFRVRGELNSDSVGVAATPVLLFAPDTTRINPSPAARTVASTPPPS